MNHARAWFQAGLVLVALWCLGCDAGPREVIVYVALDNVFSREVLAEFEAETGLVVRAVFDTEATKTTGLVERLRRERNRPRCDVFWSNELLRTIRLADEGVLAPYESPSARQIPARFRDPQHRWVGIAARARVLCFDPQRVAAAEVPRSHQALLEPRWRGQLCLADPRFGTTGSHLAVLMATWGGARTREWLEGLRAQEAEVVAGNATSRDRILSGQQQIGLTDTDDVEVVRRQGSSIAESFLEQDGVILIPNSVALVAGAPHPAAARRLIDFLLDERIEARLAAGPSRQIPVRRAVPVPPGGLRLADLRLLEIDYPAAARLLPEAVRLATEVLRR